MNPSRPPASAPLAARDFNGEKLLEELGQLRVGQVRQGQLNDCAQAVRVLGRLSANEAGTRLKTLATTRFGTVPALSTLLQRWAGQLRSDVDVPHLVEHVERLALASALIGALRRGTELLAARGAGS